MLVLSRTPMQKIQIGDNVTITVLRIKGNQIKLGIEAPRDVRVVRSELPPRDAAEESTPVVTSELEVDAAAETDGQHEVASEPVRATRTSGQRFASVERAQASFAPASSPRWSGVPRTPGTAPLFSRVAGRS